MGIRGGGAGRGGRNGDSAGAETPASAASSSRERMGRWDERGGMGNRGDERVADEKSGVSGVGRENDALRRAAFKERSVALEGRSVMGARTCGRWRVRFRGGVAKTRSAWGLGGLEAAGEFSSRGFHAADRGGVGSEPERTGDVAPVPRPAAADDHGGKSQDRPAATSSTLESCTDAS